MITELLVSSTENLLKYSGRIIRVIPKVKDIKIKFKVDAKKGCGRVAIK